MAYNPLLNPHPVSGPLTDAQLRASAVPVVALDATAGPTAITATDSAGGGVPSGTGAFIATAPTAGSFVAIACPGGDSAWNVQVTGLTTGSLYFEGSLDSTNGSDGNWINVNGRRTGVVNTELSGAATANGSYRGNTSGLKYFRVRSAGGVSGSPVVLIRVSDGTGAIFLNASVPAGSNLIGRVGSATDVARVTRNFLFDTPTASPAAETLMSLTQWYNNAAVAATTTPAVVPAGKILRIDGMRVNTASLASAGMVVLRLRANVAGVVAIGSPLVASLQCGSQAAVAALQDWQTITFPNGILFPAGTGVGLTHQGYVGATGTLQSFTRAEMWGYEYTA